SDRIPFFRRRLIEVGIREEPQPDDAAGVTVDRSDRQVLASRPDRYTRILLLVLERIGSAIRTTPIEPETESLLVGPGGLLEARLVDQPQIEPPVVAARFVEPLDPGLLCGHKSRVFFGIVGGERLEKVERAGAPPRNLVPETI